MWLARCAGDVVDVILQNNMANAFNGDYRWADSRSQLSPVMPPKEIVMIPTLSSITIGQ